MPNGLDGLAEAFSDFAGGVTNDVSVFETRTQDNVTAYYQEWVGASNIVQRLSGLLYNGILSGFSSLNDFLMQIVGALLGPEAEIVGKGVEELLQMIQDSIGGVFNSVTWLVGQAEDAVYKDTLLPIQSLVDGVPQSLQLQLEPGFNDPDCISANNDWSWDDTVGHTSVGCAATFGGGVDKMLVGTVIPVADNHTVVVEAWVMWDGLNSAGWPVEVDLLVTNTDGSTFVQPVGVVESTLTSIPWTYVSNGLGGWPIPTGAATVQVRLWVRGEATAGQFWFDDVTVVRNGVFKLEWVDQLETSLAGLLSVSTWQQFLGQIYWTLVGGVKGPVDALDATALAVIKWFSSITLNGLLNAASLANMEKIPNLLASSVVRAFDDAPVTIEENMVSILNNFEIVATAFGETNVVKDLEGVGAGLSGGINFFASNFMNALTGVENFESTAINDLKGTVGTFQTMLTQLQNTVGGLSTTLTTDFQGVVNEFHSIAPWL